MPNQRRHHPALLVVLRKALGLLWQADRIQLGLSIFTVIIQGFLPAIIAYITKLIIDHLTSSSEPDNILWWLLVAEFVAVLTMNILMKFAERSRFIMGEQVQKMLRMRLIQHASDLDLEFFESPSNFDALSKAQRELGFRPVMLVMALLAIAQGSASLLSYTGILLILYPVLLIPVFLSVIPALVFANRSSMMMFDLFDYLTPEGRRAAYLETLGIEKYFAKEVRLFGLRDWILRRVHSYLESMMQKRLATERIKVIRDVLSEFISTSVSYGALAYIMYLAATKTISLGTFILAIGAVTNVRGNLMILASQVGELLENSLLFADLDRFFAFKSNLYRPETSTQIPTIFQSGFKLEQLHFTYPGSSKPIFSGLDLTIQAGQATALVGVNGAGKTTLVKLLTRLYDPSAGQITLNGTDIREFDLESYRKMFAVLLQDFAQYQMSARDNIILAQGNSNETQNASNLEQTAINAGALELIQGLPNGWDTLLGRLFDEQGQDLSGGQWQRIALARALYRQAPILILDEPSAALDAEAEAELFERYREFAKGKLSLLITHRFNTVRFADRIIVLEEGRVVEDGSHAELMRVQGRYFEMFTAQASAYEIPA
jgi:ATP-binding cassette, subfamily B, bacterial